MRTRGIALTLTLAAILAIGGEARAGAGTEIFDARGKLVTVVRGKQHRIHVALQDVPEIARLAVIAIEDSRFYDHHGVDLRGLARALWTDIRAHGKVQGGSTITQQLVKNKYTGAQKTLQRKVDEALMALEMERQYTKDQILEMYLNEVYWGHGAYGIEAASQTYFGHSCRTLNLSEGALLAAMLKGPEKFSPYRNHDLAIERQHTVLDRMAELGIVTQDEAERAKKRPLNLLGAPGEGYGAPYFTNYVLNQLIDRYGADAVMQGDLKVQTTLDLATQQAAERYVKELVATKGRRYRFNQAALVALNPNTGGILAMVGGADYRQSQYNRAVLAHRQPGSTFKPFVYLTAFAQGVSPTETMRDDPATYMVNGRPYTPRNYQGEREGTMTLKRALELSNNVVTIKLLDRIGPENVVQTARKLGVTSPLQPTLSLGLGAYEVTPLEIASVYGVLAADGVRNEPIAYWNVRDGSGRMLEERHPAPQRVYDETPIRELTNALTGVIMQGTGTAANIGRPVAGKTGTTTDSRDAWFVGYTPQLAVALWVGNDDNSKMAASAAGGVVAAPTWGKFMKTVLAKVPVLQFPGASGSVAASRSIRPGTASLPVAKPHLTPAPSRTPESTPEPRDDEDLAPDANL